MPHSGGSRNRGGGRPRGRKASEAELRRSVWPATPLERWSQSNSWDLSLALRSLEDESSFVASNRCQRHRGTLAGLFLGIICLITGLSPAPFWPHWTAAALKDSLSMGFPRQEPGGLFPSPGASSDPGIKPTSPWQAGSFSLSLSASTCVVTIPWKLHAVLFNPHLAYPGWYHVPPWL